MAIQVIETTTFFTDSAAANSRTITLATTPQAGDVVFVFATTGANRSQTVTGLGATWTSQFVKVQIGNAASYIWAGTGATAAGNITVTTSSTATTGRFGALLVRGLPSGWTTFRTDSTDYTTGSSSSVGAVEYLPQVRLGPSSIILGVAEFSGGITGGGITFPASGSSAGWTSDTGPLNAAGSTGIGGAAWKVASAGSDVLLGVANTGSTGGFIDCSAIYITDGSDGAIVESDYVEVLTTGTPAAVIESAYTEALTVGTPAAAVESSYVEVLSKVDETNLVKVVEVGIADITATGTLSRTPSLATTPLAGDVVVLAYQLRSEGGSNPIPTALTASGLGASWTQAYYVTGGAEFASAVWLGTGATASGTITASWTNSSRAGSVRAFLVRNLTSTTVTADSTSSVAGGTGTTLGPTLNAKYGNFILDLLSQGFGNTSVSQIPSAYLPTSRWITQPNSESLGRYASTYRIPELNSIESHRVDKNLDSGFTESTGGLLVQAVIGPVPTTVLTATGTAGFTIGAASTAKNNLGGYDNAILFDDPFGYWRLNETSGTSAADATGNGNTGTLTNFPASFTAPGLITGSADSAITFDGNDDLISVSSAAVTSFTGASSFTAEAWIKPSRVSGTNVIVARHGNSNIIFSLRIQDGVLWTYVWAYPGNWQGTSGGTIAVGQTYHVAVTYNASTYVRTLYLNGAALASNTNQIGTSANPPITIGSNGVGSERYQGVIDEVVLYQRALSTTDINRHYVAGTTTPSGPLTTTGSLPFTVGATGNVWFITTGQVGFTASVADSTLSSVATPTGTLPATASITGQAYGIASGTAALTASASSTEYGITTGLTVGFTASLQTSTIFKIIPTTGTVPFTSTLTASPMGITSALEALTISNTGTPVGVATGMLGLNLDFSMRDAGVVVVGIPTTVGMTTLAAGAAFSDLTTTIGAPVQVAGAATSAVGFTLSIFDSTLDCTKFRWVYTDSEGWLTSTITVHTESATISIGQLSSSTGFYAKLNSALAANGSLVSTITGQQISLAVNYEGFGTLQTHLASFLKDVTVWFAGPVAESLYTTGPAAGVGTGHGPYLENDYWISGPED